MLTGTAAGSEHIGFQSGFAPYLCGSVSLQEKTRIETAPLSAGSVAGEIAIGEDEEVDQLAAREFGAEQGAQTAVHVLCIPGGPFGIGAVDVAKGLVMRVACFGEELFEPWVKVFVG